MSGGAGYTEGGLLDSIVFMEQSLAQRVQAFGTEEAETIRQWKKLNTEYNISAMKYLQTDEFDTALGLLNRAKQLITSPVKFGEMDDRRKLLAITYNNMSCIFKRRGLLKTALGYAEKALKLETQSTKADNPACTHLNLCAILSRLDRHRHALEHCKCALDLIRAGNYCGAETPGLMNAFHDGAEPESSILAVCYHNMAVEHEYLGEHDKALQAYYKSVEVAGSELGPDHPVTNAFAERADEAAANLESKRKAAREHRAARGKVRDYDKKLMSVALGTPRKGGMTPRGV